MFAIRLVVLIPDQMGHQPELPSFSFREQRHQIRSRNPHRFLANRSKDPLQLLENARYTKADLIWQHGDKKTQWWLPRRSTLSLTWSTTEPSLKPSSPRPRPIKLSWLDTRWVSSEEKSLKEARLNLVFRNLPTTKRIFTNRSINTGKGREEIKAKTREEYV
jgi:hypothetical protein